MTPLTDTIRELDTLRGRATTEEQNVWLRLLEKWAEADDKKTPKKEKP